MDQLKLGLGLQINQLIQSKSKEEIVSTMPFTEEQITETTEQKNMELFKKTNYGLTAGASYTFLKNFCFEARYYFGLSNIYNEDKLPK
ncbi:MULTISPECIES: PorT family protein [unclassified Flavobacterium]|uniref:PorT family protein n=1 Tax=unclassified Flavobacterium TaxID=196869 RepID=UPI002224FB70|nr:MULTISPECIES: PorT family protein [unclassified Flavobacterium]